MIGDWSGAELDTQKTVTEQTGIYGFNKGVMSYALTEDGNAFFGKYGSGRIYINGDDASLYSGGYKSNRGMKIDLGTSSSYPFIDMRQGTDNYIKMGFDSSSYPQLRIQNGKGYILLTSREGQSKISLTGEKVYNNLTRTGTITLSGVSGEDPLTIGTKFSVGWDGTITSSGGTFNDIAAESGYLNNLDIQGDLTVYLGSSRTGPIYFRNTAINNTLYGYIGYIEGATSFSTTRNIGIVTSNSTGIVFNSATNFRATATTGDVYLDGEKIGFVGGDSYVFTYSYQRTSEYTNLGISPADRGAAVLYTNIPAGNQFGIYARFA